MATTRTRARACGRKRRYPDRATATRDLARIERETGTVRLVAYLCPHCGAWHVGHEHPGRR